MPWSETPEKSMNVVEIEHNKGHGETTAVGLSEVVREVNLVNLTGFRIS